MAPERIAARPGSKSVLRATTTQDAPEVIAFLARFLHTEAVAPPMVDWKLWARRDDYSDPRSFILEKNGKIIAHAGVWPIVIQTSSGPLRGCHLFDWAADPRALGAGVAIVQRVAEMFDFAYGIGGSEMTQKIVPAIGFKQVGESWSAARPLRPFRQIASHQFMNWKLPARLLRNAMWSATPANPRTDGWTTREGISQSDSHLLQLQASPYIIRSDGFFRYLQACPGVQIRVFDLLKDDRRAGRLALSFLHHQARLAGIWLDCPSEENLKAAYSLAQEISRRAGSAYEIVATGSSPASETAAVASGFRICKRTPIYLMSTKWDNVPASFEFQMAENDALFQSTGGPSYWT